MADTIATPTLPTPDGPPTPLAIVNCGNRSIEILPPHHAGGVAELAIAWHARQTGERRCMTVHLRPAEARQIIASLSRALGGSGSSPPPMSAARQRGQPPLSWVETARTAREES